MTKPTVFLRISWSLHVFSAFVSRFARWTCTKEPNAHIFKGRRMHVCGVTNSDLTPRGPGRLLLSGSVEPLDPEEERFKCLRVPLLGAFPVTPLRGPWPWPFETGESSMDSGNHHSQALCEGAPTREVRARAARERAGHGTDLHLGRRVHGGAAMVRRPLLFLDRSEVTGAEGRQCQALATEWAASLM